MIIRLCSACLLGIKCRFDGESKPNEKIIALLEKEVLIPICPEQLGGLSTPRTPSEQKGGKVFTKDGEDVTLQFQKGAEEVVKLAKLMNCDEAILKARSPSCGSGKIFDGTFSGKLIEGDGITTKLLKENNNKISTEEDF